MSDDGNFLSRWSQRKLRKKHEEEAAAEAEAREAEVAAKDLSPMDPPAEDVPAGGLPAEGLPEEGTEAAPERHPAEDIDIDSLTKESDFTIFMQAGVPKDVKRRALRKLWTSDPVLANLDGLNDYEDMQRVYGMGPIGETAWKIGRGFLTDDEVGLNAREKEEPREEAAPAAEDAQPEQVELASTDLPDVQDAEETAATETADEEKAERSPALDDAEDDEPGRA